MITMQVALLFVCLYDFFKLLFFWNRKHTWTNCKWEQFGPNKFKGTQIEFGKYILYVNKFFEQKYEAQCKSKISLVGQELCKTF